jgi:hypothetical protein
MAPAWRYLVAALVVAEAAHEKYVIQAFDPAHVGAIDAKPPDGASTIELSAGTNTSTKVSYSVARNGQRKGVAQMTHMRPMNCAGAEALSLKYRVAEPQSVPSYVTLRFIVFEGSHCERTAPASECDGSEPDLLEQYYHSVWKSISYGETATMAWGARNLMSAQVPLVPLHPRRHFK